MLAPRLNSVLLAFALCGAGMAAGAGEGGSGAADHKTAQLERQVATLRESYALSRADADEARRQLRDIRARLEAIGGSALGSGEERLVDMAAQLEAANAELETLRQSALVLSSAVDTGRTAARPQEPQEDPKQGGLTAAGGAYNGNQLIGFDF